MPWLSLGIWLLTFLFSKSKGASTAQAAGIATLAGGATYLLADPSNPDNLLGLGQSTGTVGAQKNIPGNTDEGSTVTQGMSDRTSTAGSDASKLLNTAITTTGSTLSSWGGAGTAAVIGTATVANSVDKSTVRKYLPWILGGLGLFLLLK